MIKQAENAMQKYQKKLEQALAKAPPEVRLEVIQDADEFLMDEIRAMDVGRLTSEIAAYDRFVQRFGTPEQLADSYLPATKVLAAHPGEKPKWIRMMVCALLMFGTIGGICYAILVNPPPNEERSPFTKVAFEGDKVLVDYDGKTWQWLAFDDLPTDKIVASSKEQFGNLWKKRIGEDLIRVLRGMKHRAGDTAKLVLLDLDSGNETLVKNAPMTRENRWAVWDGNNPEDLRNLREMMRVHAAAKRRNNSKQPPDRSPFTKVQFKGDKILVEHEGTMYQWLEIDGLHVDKIVASAKKQFGGSWQKRVAEDLVDVLAGMDHKPGEYVQLKLVDLEKNKEFTVEMVAMTKAKRWAVWKDQVDSEAAGRLPAGANAPLTLSTKLVNEFKKQLEARWAYYVPTKEKIVGELVRIEKDIADTSKPGDMLVELQKVIAKGIDGHASVRGWRLPGKCSPFLIESVGNRFVAVSPERNSFVNNDHPFIDSIDGVPIADWCNDATVLVAQGSPQLVRDRTSRLLRHIDYWRSERSMPTGPELKLKLSSKSGASVEESVATVDRKPIYGDWPRRKSTVHDGAIGYLRIPSMDSDALTEIRSSMAKFKNTEGIVVDVRGNGGGSRDALRLMAAYLMSPADSPRVANVAKYRLHPEFGTDHLGNRFLYPADSSRWSADEESAIKKFAKSFKPEWEPPAKQFSDWHFMVLNRMSDDDVYYYDKPVVVLADAGCFSATDIFLAGLKGWRNVTLVGTASSGGSARSVSFTVPGTPVVVKIASMASFQPDGSFYDGRGVEPDIVVQPSAEYFIGNDDPAFEKAIELIRK